MDNKSLIDLFKARYSERYFDPGKDIAGEKLEKLLEAARIAPTASNRQAFRLYLLQAERGREILSNFNAPVHILLTAVAQEAWRREEDGFNAAELDIGIVGTHIMLEAEAQGLKSCLICAFAVEKLKKALKLPAEETPVMAVALGYASAESRPSARHEMRKELKDILTVYK